MKLRKILITILAVLACCCCALFVACAKNEIAGYDENTYTGFEVPVKTYLPYGNYKELSMPISLDCYGNVLGVNCEILNSQGETEETINSAGFFAIDSAYSISYSITLPNKKVVNKATAVEVVKYKNHGLLDTTVKTSFRLSNLEGFPSDIAEGFALKYTVVASGMEYEGCIDNSGTFNVYYFDANGEYKTLPDGVYSIKAVMTGRGLVPFNVCDLKLEVLKNEHEITPVWSKAKNEMLASEVIAGGYYYEFSQWPETETSTGSFAPVTVVDIPTDGVSKAQNYDGKYYRIAPSAYQLLREGDFNVKIKPLHSQAYYSREDFANKSLKIRYCITTADGIFHEYIDSEGNPSTECFVTKYGGIKEALGQAQLGVWQEMTIRFKDLPKNFSYFEKFVSNSKTGVPMWEFSFIDIYKGVCNNNALEASLANQFICYMTAVEVV